MDRNYLKEVTRIKVETKSCSCAGKNGPRADSPGYKNVPRADSPDYKKGKIGQAA